MQMGSVGAYQPEAVVNDTRAVTMEADVTDSLIPSLLPFAPEPVAVVEAPKIAPWIVGALAIGAIYLLFFSKAR